MLTQSLLLGSTQIRVSAMVNTPITVSTGSVTMVLTRSPVWAAVQRWVMAGVLGGLAIRMATEARH